MSGERIKYSDHKYKANHRISNKAYTSKSTGAKYRIILNLEEMIYCIRNERTKSYIFKSGSYTNLNVLKRTARAKLESYGIQLKRESRDRSFGLCSAGTTQEKWEQKESFQIDIEDEL